MKEHLLMSRKELDRKSLLDLVVEKHMTVAEAARRMGVGYRQALRIRDRFVAFGDEGLVHRNRGRVSNRARPGAFQEQVLKRYQERYMEHDLGPTLAVEKLAKDGLHIDHETLRRWLMRAGYWQRKKRGNGHRSRRERRGHFGELVQMDGSHHRWFGPDKEQVCLMNMIDDATGETLGLMAAQETTKAAMHTLWRWIEKYGIPRALYTDKKNVYITGREATLEEQLAGEKPLTEFGKACKKLGIEIIPAHSPQAKGRVERSNGTYQDRFVKELALRGITTIATADRLLDSEFCDDLNGKFAIAPREEKDYHRPVPEDLALRDIFCFEEDRVVQNDWTIRYENRHYQILANNSPRPRPKNKVVVRTHLDGRVELLYRDQLLAYRCLTSRQLEQEQKRKAQSFPPPAKPRPKAKHPAPKKRWCPNVGRLPIMNEKTP